MAALVTSTARRPGRAASIDLMPHEVSHGGLAAAHGALELLWLKLCDVVLPVFEVCLSRRPAPLALCVILGRIPAVCLAFRYLMHLWIVGSRSSLLALPASVAVMTPPSVSCCARRWGSMSSRGAMILCRRAL